jgi:hypothetical protein
MESIQPLENHPVEFRFKAADKWTVGTDSLDVALQYQDDIRSQIYPGRKAVSNG